MFLVQTIQVLQTNNRKQAIFILVNTCINIFVKSYECILNMMQNKEMLLYKLSSSLLGFLCFSKFAIWFKWKAKQNQLKFIFPMLFCISYKFLACFPNIILMSLDSLEWTGFIVHAKNHVIYISESMFNDGHVWFFNNRCLFFFLRLP